MNLKFRGNDLIVFLNKEEINKINFDSKFELEKYFRELFIKIKRIYNINFKGGYDINIYIDKKIGIILEIINEEVEYFEYDDIIDMNLKQIIDEFIFKTEINSLNVDTYLYNDDIYVKPKELKNIEVGILIENSTLIYGEESKKIMNDLNTVKLDKIW